MFFNLDQQQIGGPNPPPWQVHYVNDKVGCTWYQGVLPEAHTHGICEFNDLDFQIRKAPPNVAAAVLDKIGLWLLATETKAHLGDIFRVLGVQYTVAPALECWTNEHPITPIEGEWPEPSCRAPAQIDRILRRPILRLAWEKDPFPEPTELRRLTAQFEAACREWGVTSA
jgi:hypothetical protein